MTCTNCHNPLPPTGGRCPRCGRVVYVRPGQPGATTPIRLDGCRREAPSPTDYRAVPRVRALPPIVDLRPDCPAVEAQGALGSCTANAIVGAFEFRQRKATGRMRDLSRLFVYYNARKMAGWEHEDSGATIGQGMAALLAFGAPSEASWPYDIARMAERPPEACYEEARADVPGEYARVDGVDHIRGALARAHPVVFASNIPDRCYEAAWTSGSVPMPTADEMAAFTSRDGTHAMLLVGYDLNAKVYFVRNSWSDQFGERGYCRLPFDVFDTVVIPQTTWILGHLETSGDFDIVRPPLQRPVVEGGAKDLAAKLREDIRASLTKDIDSAMKDVKQRFTPGRQG